MSKKKSSFPRVPRVGTPVRRFDGNIGLVVNPEFEPLYSVYDDWVSGKIVWVVLPNGIISGWWRVNELMSVSALRWALSVFLWTRRTKNMTDTDVLVDINYMHDYDLS